MSPESACCVGGELTVEQAYVIAIISETLPLDRPYRVQQADIALILYGFDSEVHRRNVRRLIRQLRVDYSMPIISDELGYFWAQDHQQITKFCALLEKKAKKATRSYFETFRAMKKNLPLKNRSIFEFFNSFLKND